jgi:predicted phosphodiesterase
MSKSIVKHQFSIPIQGVKKKCFFQFSDTHLSLYDELSNEQEKETAIKCEELWHSVRDDFAKAHEDELPSERKISAKEHFENLLSEAEKGDFLLMAGDILDYISPANTRFLNKKLSDFSKPYMVVRGNHECGEISSLCGMEKLVQVKDLGDLMVVGIDNSDMKIKLQQLEQLETVMKTKKPIVLLMHVPIITDANRSSIEKAGDYFILNRAGCPQENIDFVNMITAKDSNVMAVFTGHLHFQCVSPLRNGLWMYGTSQGIAGHLHEYLIGE